MDLYHTRCENVQTYLKFRNVSGCKFITPHYQVRGQFITQYLRTKNEDIRCHCLLNIFASSPPLSELVNKTSLGIEEVSNEDKVDHLPIVSMNII